MDQIRAEGHAGEVKVLTSCPSCLQGLKRYHDDAELDADYIVVEIAKHVLGAGLAAGVRSPREHGRHRARAGLRRRRPHSQNESPPAAIAPLNFRDYSVRRMKSATLSCSALSEASLAYTMWPDS